jgi:hypothetical protein
VDLRFDDDATAEFFGGCFGFFGSAGHLASRHGDAMTGKEGLGLILVNLHDLFEKLL